eukprot:1879942-Prymnesium_polylepis.1
MRNGQGPAVHVPRPFSLSAVRCVTKPDHSDRGGSPAPAGFCSDLSGVPYCACRPAYPVHP